MINPGNYKAKAVKGSAQVGETDKGTLQIAVDLDVKDTSGQSLGVMTTFLYFSDAAQTYSYERLKALGWEGKGPEDIDKLDKIDLNEVDVRVTQPEQYRDPTTGVMKNGNSKIEILTGTGKVTIQKPLDMGTFKARLKALSGSAAGGGAATSGDTKPPF